MWPILPHLPLYLQLRLMKNNVVEEKITCDSGLCVYVIYSTGMEGRPISLVTNHYQIEISDLLQYIQHYDVKFDPKIESKRIKRKIFEQCKSAHGKVFSKYGVGFDGVASIYTSDMLPLKNNEGTLDVNFEDERGKRSFKITLKHARQLDIRPLKDYFQGKYRMPITEVVQAFDVVLRHLPSLNFTAIGRSFFTPENASDVLGEGRIIWYGYRQSVRPAMWKPTLNIDITATVFYKSEPVLDFIRAQFPRWRIGDNFLSDRFMTKSLKLQLKYMKTLVFLFFFFFFFFFFRYPHLPCLHVGDEKKTTFLPIELCTIAPGQHCQNVTDAQKSKLIRMDSSKIPEDPIAAKFGISISNKMTKYTSDENSSEVRPRDGSWNIQKSFVDPKSATSWAICTLKLRFINEQICCEPPKGIYTFEGNNLRSVRELFAWILKEIPDVQIIVVVLDDRGFYPNVKIVGDVELGIMTQCLQAKNVIKCANRERGFEMLLVNILLKINSKLGGINHKLHKRIKQVDKVLKPCIMFGADVTHPSPGDFTSPSVAAVLSYEMKAVRDACQELHPDYKPGITFLIVQKRHNTRFFCERREDESGKASNIPPGTVVDKGVGTSRPTHYYILHDDNNFTADEMQKLTYYLCHTYVRCSKSVSMPSPAYYAHLVAFRARYHLINRRDDRLVFMFMYWNILFFKSLANLFL
ncbi:Protein argonaute-4 [Nymphon striatum]|nr:Protein argonaute-4 [Nymphon striatum]